MSEDPGSSNLAMGPVSIEKSGGYVWWLPSHRPIDGEHGGFTVG